jgi:hypothetical protein
MAQVDMQVRTAPEALEAGPTPEVSRGLAVFAGIAWVVGYQAMLALEPAAANPDAVPGFFASLVSLAVLAGFATMTVGLLGRARWAFAASGATALVVVGQVVACPITGHHSLGLWWGLQASIAAGLVVLSLAGWQAAARSARAAH